MFTKVIKALNNFLERLTPKQLLIGVAAFGVLVTLMVYLTLSHIEDELIAEQPEPVEMTKVVVATVNIPRGVILKDNMLRVKEFAVKSLPEGTSSDVKFFVGLPTKLEIFQDDIMTIDKVFTDYREAGFIGMIPEDCRAVSIPIDTVTGISGLLKPGDYVDVILVSSAGNQGLKAEVLLQNILLLSINKNADREIEPKKRADDGSLDELKEEAEGISKAASDAQKGAEDLVNKGQQINRDMADSFEGKGAKGLGAAGAGNGGGSGEDLGTATLALRPDDVLKVTAAIQAGTIHLALRPLKPQGDSMFISETDYYIYNGSGPVSQSFLDRQNRQYQPNVSPPPVVTRPPVTSVAPVAPSAPPSTSTGNVDSSGGGKADKGFEVIQWGN